MQNEAGGYGVCLWFFVWCVCLLVFCLVGVGWLVVCCIWFFFPFSLNVTCVGLVTLSVLLAT